MYFITQPVLPHSQNVIGSVVPPSDSLSWLKSLTKTSRVCVFQQLKTEMLDQFDAQLQDLVDNLMQEVDATLNPGKPFDSSLPGKRFVFPTTVSRTVPQ